MIKMIRHLAFFSSAMIFLILSPLIHAGTPPFLLGYWGNWHVWDVDKNGRPNDDYQIPGSINKETGATVVNLILQKQLANLSAIAYAFFEVYPDPGMFSDVPQKPVNESDIGKIYFSDPWTDLFNNPGNIQFCNANPIACFFAYEIEKDPNNPRPPVDKSQPWNYFRMGNFDAFAKLPNVKRFISIGGWYHEASFEKGAFKNPTNFVNSLVAIIQKVQAEGGNIDGIDLDYEPATGYTTENATKLAELAKTLRAGLDQHGLQNVMITAAVFADPAKIEKFGAKNWQSFAETLNYIGIMGYDFHGVWDNPPITGLQSNLYQDPNNPNQNDFSVVKAVEKLNQAGVPKQKLVVGIPSYGRILGGVQTGNNGLYQTFDPNLVPKEDLDKGQVSYYKLINRLINHGFTAHSLLLYGKAMGAWAYNPNNLQFASFDTTEVVDTKANYVLSEQLGGMMMWELIADTSPDDASSLVKKMHDILN